MGSGRDSVPDPIRASGVAGPLARQPKLLDRLAAALRARHYSPRQELLGHKDVKTTMIYTHVLKKGGLGVRSTVDSLRPCPGGLLQKPDKIPTGGVLRNNVRGQFLREFHA